ncbi:hypothetical protein HQN90_20290 [Paenibacillus alba]|uniref:DUF6906 family protein n=1 Tax=Paenibacillus alba TaxID=1197127 RepID=UPI001566D8E4|nr:hypothetical protein [Paenibacillus alba]NQX68468.1 hypothetical protein [Paenibacillus alba]
MNQGFELSPPQVISLKAAGWDPKKYLANSETADEIVLIALATGKLVIFKKSL